MVSDTSHIKKFFFLLNFFWISTELVPRPIQYISCNVCVFYDVDLCVPSLAIVSKCLFLFPLPPEGFCRFLLVSFSLCCLCLFIYF